jgi:uncharacterized RDD family membrane protein YckC
MSAAPDVERDVSLQGAYAGIVSRLGSFVIDVAVIIILFALAGSVIDYVVSAVRGEDFQMRDAPIAAIVLLVAWTIFYCAYPLAVAGRTFGMAVVGVRVIRKDGGDLDGWHALIRVLVFPLSFLLLGFGFLLIVLKRDRRALHDLIAGSCVIYSWNARAARLRFLAKTSSPAAH